MSPAGTARAVQGGYVPPMKRDACRNCANGTMRVSGDRAYYDRKRVHCSVFKTELNCGGICGNYARKSSG